MTKAFCPGSFDPIHLGHLDVIQQAVELFGSAVVCVMHNREKMTGMFDVAERVRLLEASLATIDGLAEQCRVTDHSGLAVDAARQLGAAVIVKGLRTASDFEIEHQMALTNYSVAAVRTVLVPCAVDLGYISSRFVREIARYGRSVGHMVPQPVADALTRKFPPRSTP